MTEEKIHQPAPGSALYTIGYQGRKPEGLLRLAEHLDVVIGDALAAGDWVTVTDALDAWERSGEMEPALWVLTGDASDGADIREVAS